MRNYNLICIIILFCITGSLKTSSQTSSIKERYDSEKSLYKYSGYSDGTNIIYQQSTGEHLSSILESFLQMYKTTKDKAYLIKFIEHAIHLQEVRGEYYRDCIDELCGAPNLTEYSKLTEFLQLKLYMQVKTFIAQG